MQTITKHDCDYMRFEGICQCCNHPQPCDVPVGECHHADALIGQKAPSDGINRIERGLIYAIVAIAVCLFWGGFLWLCGVGR